MDVPKGTLYLHPCNLSLSGRPEGLKVLSKLENDLQKKSGVQYPPPLE
jgi:hypothetical protein